MKLVKSLLLGSAAGIVAIAGANAADLPNKKGAPVEYVRICSQYGAGFFYVPGSDICVQIGGRVRADTVYNQTYQRNADSFGFGAQARINLDVRQNTPYGVVRAYLRYALARTSSGWNTSGNYVNNTAPANGDGGGLDRAFIQFAGLTAGRVQSFFDFYADNYNFAAIRNSDVATQTLAYTANFGNGWSLTGAIEDGNNRRLYNKYGTGANAVGYGAAGQTVPDFVAALMVNQSWGSAQLSAALHQVRPAFFGNNLDTNKDATLGWAVHGGVQLKLPSIAPGDELWVEAAYSQGALSYIGANNYGWTPNLSGAGGAYMPIADAFVGVNGGIKLSSGFSVMADFLHYWTPNWRSNVFASYMKIDTNRNAYGTFTLGNQVFNAGFVPASEFRVGTNLIWSPVKNFDIGVEVLYTRVDPKGRVLSWNNGLPLKTISSDDNWQGRLRIQRDF